MSEHHASIRWRRTTPDFAYESYNRDHVWEFDREVRIAASAAPGYGGHPDRVDPEKAFVASLSSCHMLTFLALAARKRIVIDEYRDEAMGFMEKNSDGKIAVTRVLLRPKIVFAGEPPAGDLLAELHQRAHEHCFIANSVRTEVSVETA